MEVMALIFPLSPSLSHTHTSLFFVVLSLFRSASQLEPTRAALVTSPLTGERRLGASIVCIHRPRPQSDTRDTLPSLSLLLRSSPVRKLENA